MAFAFVCFYVTVNIENSVFVYIVILTFCIMPYRKTSSHLCARVWFFVLLHLFRLFMYNLQLFFVQFSIVFASEFFGTFLFPKVWLTRFFSFRKKRTKYHWFFFTLKIACVCGNKFLFFFSLDCLKAITSGKKIECEIPQPAYCLV